MPPDEATTPIEPPPRITVPPGVDPTVAMLLQQNADQQHTSSFERRSQTKAFTNALDKLGGRIEEKVDTQTQALVGAVGKAATTAAVVFVVVVLVLGSIGGAVVSLKGGRYEANTNGATSAASLPTDVAPK